MSEELADSLVELQPEASGSYWVRAMVCFTAMVAAYSRGDCHVSVKYALKTLESLADFERLAQVTNEASYVRAATYRYLGSADGDGKTAQEQVEHAMPTVEETFEAKIDSANLRMLHLRLLEDLGLTSPRRIPGSR